MKLVIAGGRDFNDPVGLWNVAKAFIDANSDFKEKVTIVSGTCRGADKLGEKFAEMEGYAVERFEADWDGLGKRAGFVRNEQMAKACTHVLVFWDGKSPGTKSMIELAAKYDKPCEIARYESQREVESNMAEKFKGELKVVKKNDYGFYSVKIGNDWYGTGSKKEPSVVVGDYVEGEFELEKGKYKTVTKAGLSKAQGTSPTTGTPTGGSASGADDKMSKAEWATKDSRIQYQHAQKVAATLIANPAILEAAGVNKAKPADKLGIIEAIFDRYTASVFGDVANFGAVTRVNAPAVDPAAPPSEDDDE